MPIPLAIPIALTAGSAIMKLFGAKKSADAAKKAAEVQAQSTREALNLQQQLFQQSRADLAPYRQSGATALAAGHQLMGLPAAAADPSMVPLSQIGTMQPGQRGPLPPGATPSGYAVNRGTVPGLPGGPGSMVLLRAPNGQTKPVPADQVDYYLARGATRG